MLSCGLYEYVVRVPIQHYRDSSAYPDVCQNFQRQHDPRTTCLALYLQHDYPLVDSAGSSNCRSLVTPADAARVNVQGWFLTDFSSAMAIVGAYLCMVTLGPMIMSQLSPIDSYPVRFVYNVIQVERKMRLELMRFRRDRLVDRPHRYRMITLVRLLLSTPQETLKLSPMGVLRTLQSKRGHHESRIELYS